MGFGSLGVWGGGASPNIQGSGSFSASAPGYSFVGVPDLGFTQSSGNAIYVVKNGMTMVFDFGSGNFRVPGTFQIGWAAADPSAGGADAGFARTAAATVKVTNGSSGYGTLATGGLNLDRTITPGGTTGAQTINKPAGTVNFAAAATTLVVTNSLVTASSIVFCVVRTNDATAVIKNVVCASGSFTITLSAAATAETSVGFFVTN